MWARYGRAPVPREQAVGEAISPLYLPYISLYPLSISPVAREQPLGEAGGQAVREQLGRGAAAAEGGEGGVEGGRVEARLLEVAGRG